MKPEAPKKPANRKEARAAAQRKRRAREHVLEAESYEEAAARLRVAFNVVDSEAAPAAAPAPQESPAGNGVPPSPSAPAGDAAPAPEPVKQASPEPESPPEQASEPTAEAKREPEPEPTVTIDPAELAPMVVDAVDEMAVEELGAKVKLDATKRERLVAALRPVLADFFRNKSGALRGLTPTENLIGTAAFIYGPALWSKYVTNADAQPAPEPGPRLVPAERTA